MTALLVSSPDGTARRNRVMLSVHVTELGLTSAAQDAPFMTGSGPEQANPPNDAIVTPGFPIGSPPTAAAIWVAWAPSSAGQYAARFSDAGRRRYARAIADDAGFCCCCRRRVIPPACACE